MITLQRARLNQKKLHEAATNLLRESGLLEVLTPYGTLELGGSYTYGLMVQPDIDLHLVAPHADSGKVEKIVRLLNHTEPFRVDKIVDTTTGQRREGAPKGWYVRLLGKYCGTPWKIDCWILREVIRDEAYPASLRDIDWINACSEKQKDAMLLIKAQLYEEQGDYTAANVYRAVLEGGAETLEDFKHWRAVNLS